jgi:hypothetical protein
MTRVRVLFGASLIFAVAAFGCAKNPHAPAKVSGSVSYKGNPVKGGTIQFYGSDGAAYSCQISPDATYSVTDIPEGELVVTVETESINPARKAAVGGKDYERRMSTMQPPPPDRAPPPASQLQGFYVKIPEKYGNSKTSPVTVVIKSGRQVRDIELD